MVRMPARSEAAPVVSPGKAAPVRRAVLWAVGNTGSGTPSWAWQSVGGLTVAHRQCLQLARQGIRRLAVVVRDEDLPQTRRLLADRRLRDVTLDVIEANAQAHVRLHVFLHRDLSGQEQFLWLRGDCVFHPAVLAELSSERGASPTGGVSAVRGQHIGDGTRPSFSLARCSAGVADWVCHGGNPCEPLQKPPFPPLSSMESDRREGFSDRQLVHPAAQPDSVRVVTVPQGWLMPIARPADADRAEQRLFQDCRKSIDGPGDRYINRYFSLAISRSLQDSRLTPNMISILTLAVGVVAALAAAGGTYANLLVGALLLQFNSVLDCVDGELARVRLEQSWIGQWLDTLSDDLSNLLFLGGLAWGVASSAGPGGLIACGIVACVSQLLMCLICYPELIATGSGDLLSLEWDFDTQPAESRWSRFLSVARWVVKRDFFILAFVAFAVAGVLPWVLPLAAVGGVASVVAATARWLSRRRQGVLPRGNSVRHATADTLAASSVARYSAPSP